MEDIKAICMELENVINKLEEAGAPSHILDKAEELYQDVEDMDEEDMSDEDEGDSEDHMEEEEPKDELHKVANKALEDEGHKPVLAIKIRVKGKK